LKKISKTGLRWCVRLSVLYIFLTYFLALTEMCGMCLPLNRRGQAHTDYTLPFLRWIPRKATAFRFVEPPITLAASGSHKVSVAENGLVGLRPIPEFGEWQFSAVQVRPGLPFYLFYFACTTSDHVHYRIGARWDDVDHFYVFPSIARISR